MKKYVLALLVMMFSLSAHAVTCTAQGYNGGQGVGQGFTLPQAEMTALAFCAQYNYGAPCFIVACTPY